MKAYSAADIRNVAVMGHSGCGKTSLMEAMLHLTKVTTRMGRVEDGNTVSDYDSEEVRVKPLLAHPLSQLSGIIPKSISWIRRVFWTLLARLRKLLACPMWH